MAEGNLNQDVLIDRVARIIAEYLAWPISRDVS